MAIPRRNEIHARFERGQKLGLALEIGLIVISLGLLPLIDWPKILQDWISTMVVLLLVPAHFLPSLVYILAAKKKDIDNLSESARFGVFDKHSLRQVVDAVLKDLQIPRRKVRV
jgi:hypothetical protein